MLHEEALADFSEAIRLAPGFAEAWLRRGALRRALADRKRAAGGSPVEGYGECVADFDEALRLHPNLAESHRERGAARSNLATWLMTRRPLPTPRRC